MLKPKVVVVTGGAKGIGRALVRSYLESGAKVAALDAAEDALLALAQEVASENLVTLACDVSDPASVQTAAARVLERFGKPELWINNAGISVLGAFEDVPAEQFDRVWRVNFQGVVNGTRAALKLMTEPERGMICNVASLNGLVPAPFMSAYTASKHAVVGFTRAIQLELRQKQSPVRAILVCPGFVKTDIMKGHNGFEFPKWLDFAVGDVESTAREIRDGIEEGAEEIIPTLNGKVVKAVSRVAPTWVARSSRVLTARNWKELLGLKPVGRK
jgi:NAD(P)-dependent dehydrogenase (short-subunit alcohol dehydrogenase family)